MTTEEINKIQEWFADNHSYIYINQLEDSVFEEFMSRSYIKEMDFERQMDCLKDYILAQGLTDVDE